MSQQIILQQKRSHYYQLHKSNWKIYRQNVLQNHKPELLKYKREWAKKDRKQKPEHYKTLYKKHNSWRAFRIFWDRIEKPIILCKVCNAVNYAKGYCIRCYKRIKAHTYYRKNPQKHIKATWKYYQSHPEKKKETDHKYSLTHKQQHNEYERLWNKKHPERKQARNNRWIAKNYDKYLKKLRNDYQKIRIIYKNLGFQQSYPKLNVIWRNIIKHRDNHFCQICGAEGLFAHHLFYQSLYPQLAFNENNGITLCKKCHDETHGKCLVKISWS